MYLIEWDKGGTRMVFRMRLFQVGGAARAVLARVQYTE